MKKRVFSIISASVYAFFATVMLYLCLDTADLKCRRLVAEVINGQIVHELKYIGFQREALPYMISAVLIAVTLILLIIRACRPSLLPDPFGLVAVSISCTRILFSDFYYEIFMLFKNLFGISLGVGVPSRFKLALIFAVIVAEIVTLCVNKKENKMQTLKGILKGKKLSVFGASMCTYDGYSNNVEHNPTIGENKQYYGTVESENVKCRDLRVSETFWGLLLGKYEMELCVNNSWSGSKILDDNPAAAGWNTRPTQLHRPDGTEPDLIVSFMGNNDFTKERPAGEITEDLFARVRSEGFVPETFAEGYAAMLSKMRNRYPRAEIFLFNMAWRTEEKSELLKKYNKIIEKCAEHYGAHIVELTESKMSGLDYAKYTCDGKLHPNAQGMQIWVELIEDAMTKCYMR